MHEPRYYDEEICEAYWTWYEIFIIHASTPDIKLTIPFLLSYLALQLQRMVDKPFRLKPYRLPSCPRLAWTLGLLVMFPFSYAPPSCYAAPPIEASSDAISGRPGAGAAPPACTGVGCEAEAGAAPATGA